MKQTDFILGREYLDLAQAEFMFYVKPSQDKNKSIFLCGSTMELCIRPNNVFVDANALACKLKLIDNNARTPNGI